MASIWIEVASLEKNVAKSLAVWIFISNIALEKIIITVIIYPYEQEGRKATIKDIPKLDVLELARISAAKTLIPIFVGLGFKEENITITFRKELNGNNASSLITNTITRNESAGK